MLEVTIWSIEHHWLVNRDVQLIEHHTLPETNNVAPESRPNPENKTDLPTSNYLIFWCEWLVSGRVNPNTTHFWGYDFSSPCKIQPTRPPLLFFSYFKWTPNVFWMFILHASCLVGSGYGVHRVLIYKRGQETVLLFWNCSKDLVFFAPWNTKEPVWAEEIYLP